MKTLILNKFSEFKQVASLSLLSIFLLAIRMKITHDFFMLFLVWNLFLAYIPYVVLMRLRFRESVSAINLILSGIIWLAFLPNAPYLLTDLIHVRHVAREWMVYEALMIASFALTGLYLGFLSLIEMSALLKIKGWIVASNTQKTFEYGILMLCGYGIYLGRVLRWNTWDVIQRPFQLCSDMLGLFLHPFEHQDAWLMICSLSLFLIVTFTLFKNHSIETSTTT